MLKPDLWVFPADSNRNSMSTQPYVVAEGSLARLILTVLLALTRTREATLIEEEIVLKTSASKSTLESQSQIHGQKPLMQ